MVHLLEECRPCCSSARYRTSSLSVSPASPTAPHGCSIKRIHLRNFMIHDDLVMIPSSRVNFVLGPNGSGKSSVVCALCLGLGGEPNDMKRGDSLKAFVKKGKSEGMIEVSCSTFHYTTQLFLHNCNRYGVHILSTANPRAQPDHGCLPTVASPSMCSSCCKTAAARIWW